MRHLLAAWVTCIALSFGASPRAQTLLPHVNVAALSVAGERLFAGGFDQGLFVVEATGAARPLPSPALSVHINALAWSAPDQVLWVGTARGLVRCHVEIQANCWRIGSLGAVHALLVRESGELVAGGDGGISVVRGERVRAFGKKQALPFRAVWALAEAAGKLYVGATNGLYWRSSADFDSSEKWQRASVVQGTLPDDWVTALLWRRGELYVGTYRGGVAHFVPSAAELVPGLTNHTFGHVNPAGLFALNESELAVASMEGLWRGPLTSPSRVPSSVTDVTAVARWEGALWVASRRGLQMLTD